MIPSPLDLPNEIVNALCGQGVLKDRCDLEDVIPIVRQEIARYDHRASKKADNDGRTLRQILEGMQDADGDDIDAIALHLTREAAIALSLLPSPKAPALDAVKLAMEVEKKLKHGPSCLEYSKPGSTGECQCGVFDLFEKLLTALAPSEPLRWTKEKPTKPGYYFLRAVEITAESTMEEIRISENCEPLWWESSVRSWIPLPEKITEFCFVPEPLQGKGGAQ